MLGGRISGRGVGSGGVVEVLVGTCVVDLMVGVSVAVSGDNNPQADSKAARAISTIHLRLQLFIIDFL